MSLDEDNSFGRESHGHPAPSSSSRAARAGPGNSRGWKERLGGPTTRRDYQPLAGQEDDSLSTAISTESGHIELRNLSSHDDDLSEDKEVADEDGPLDDPAADMDVSRPFPIDPDEPFETHQLTFRALFVGCCLGAIVGASNIYLGLKTGFTFGPQLFGAIFGYAILKPISRAVPTSGLLARLFGGEFGPKENCTVQSAATAAGGVGLLFVSAVPAMYSLGLLSANPSQDVVKLLSLTVCAGFFGVFFVIPLRKYYIIKQKLTFPTPAATAYTIRALHNSRTGAAAARKKSMGLLYSFVGVFVYKIMTGYAPGIIYDWHIGWVLFRMGFTSMIGLDNYGWWIEFTPAFFGAGLLSGLNASWSFFAGSVLAWGIIAPVIVNSGLAVGQQPHPQDFPEIWSYTSLSFKNPERYITAPSPRYWLLWPGVLMMLVYSFSEVIFSMGALFPGMTSAHWDPRRWLKKDAPQHIEDDEDETPEEDLVPTLWWTTGLALSSVMSCAILSSMFDMSVGQAALSLILGFLFSFIGVQSSGQTDVNPISTVAKASQLIFGGVSKGAGMTQSAAQMVNLSAGVIAAGSAAQATDMTGDLKTGYLLRAKPRTQFIAQVVGSFVAVFLNVGLFILFTSSAPCILTGEQPCPYGAPSVAAWAAVAVGTTSPHLPIPPSSGYTAIALSLAAFVTVFIKHRWISKDNWEYVPNWNAVGLGFVVPQVFYAIAMAVGSVFNVWWAKRYPAAYDTYMFAISAGLLAGEGLGGVFQALLAVVGLDGSKGYGTTIGCPAFEFCG